ncbi:MAG TPA: N-methyl-L-tryptophan oxidase [Rhizomicrobium sp.]|jgi:sarcosine oxidase
MPAETDYDVIIVGLGAMGAAALYQLSKRQVRVLGIDRYDPPHDNGSSHGETRITRLSNGESAHYTPMVRRSNEIWRELERETGRKLLDQCGGLIISGTGGDHMHVPGFFQKTRDNAKANRIDHQIWSAAEIREHYPQFTVYDGDIGYFEPEAGYLRPEECIAAQLELAAKAGTTTILRNTELRGYVERPGHVTVKTPDGTFSARTLILSAGAWIPQILGGEFARLLRVHRQMLYWFEATDAEAWQPGRFPIFIWGVPDKREGIYGFPEARKGGGVKIATEQYDVVTTPGEMTREPTADERHEIEALARTHLPGLGRCIRTEACLYTVTPDQEFLIDRASRRVIVASACSGHGFKHSAAIGEMLCNLALLQPFQFR